MRTLKQALMAATVAATFAGAAGVANAAPRSVDPFTDGAYSATGPRSVYTDGSFSAIGKRDPFTDGGHSMGQRDVYTDGSFSATGKRDAFTDGA